MGPVWLIDDWRNPHGAVTFRWRPEAGQPEPADEGSPTEESPSHRSPGCRSATTTAPPSTATNPPRQPRLRPAYRHIGDGWFITGDTGGAIKVRHIDVYRVAPANPGPLDRYMTRQRILVIPPA
jgi:hypothetical protein